MFIPPRVADFSKPLKLAVLISGSGSGMEALVKYQQSKDCAHITTIVISNQEGVEGMIRAEELGVKSQVIELPHDEKISGDKARRLHEEMIHNRLIELNIEAVILSGYMRILSPWFVNHWEGRLLNIHPSLLPDFPGAHAHRDVLAAQAKITGCTVHYVDAGMDSGKIISQREVEVFADDNEASLSSRVKLVEHVLYPQTIDDFATGNLS
ncbi:MAG: phosphoribosylglycinamide formyltransferase [Candidatus Poseidoniaceae archaeon]|jgi:formyltetrahydrofolate-dependent phosphoribosylglycinamide formyltransferase|nr:phosphoribosylglycinamide formyltransferase [Candidatus Poseidoniaceae archaeon]MDP7001097.1 phosphoribosylglycinamide formyltransferase [Candidatus Poseidoniaceae archaeon]